MKIKNPEIIIPVQTPPMKSKPVQQGYCLISTYTATTKTEREKKLKKPAGI